MDAGHVGLLLALVLSWSFRPRAVRPPVVQPQGSVTLADWHRWLAERRGSVGRAS